MERDRFFKPDEAVEYGLIDKVISSTHWHRVLDRAEALDLDAHDVARRQELRRVHRHADAARACR